MLIGDWGLVLIQYLSEQCWCVHVGDIRSSAANFLKAVGQNRMLHCNMIIVELPVLSCAAKGVLTLRTLFAINPSM